MNTDNKQITANITLTLDEIQILNNILQNSTPSVPFGTVSAFISKINTQLQNQLQQYNNKTEERPKAVSDRPDPEKDSVPTDAEGKE